MAERLDLKAYQESTVQRAVGQERLLVLADPGLGKSVMALETFRRLWTWCEAESMLVVAPLRVCQLVWPREVARWEPYAGFRVQLLHGETRRPEYLQGAQVYVINGDLVALQWLREQRWRWPELLVVDESQRFKRKSAKRSRALAHVAAKCPRRMLLTGSPAPNGLENLHGQAYLLDGGQALYSNVGDFRERWSVPVPTGHGGVRWRTRKGSEQEIYRRLAPLAVRLDAADHLDLPPLVQTHVPVELPPEARALYDQLRRDLVVALGDGAVTAPNAGVLYGKCQQVANGVVYLSDRGRAPRVVHRAKVEALESLVDELQGQPLLVAYRRDHELALIRETLDLPAINGDTSGREAARIEAAWNGGDLPALAIQPQAGGLGLNLQLGGAHHLCWFNIPDDPEEHDQLVARLRRQGQEADRVMAYYLEAERTTDQAAFANLARKDGEQRGLLDFLREEEGVTPRAGG